MRSPSTITIAFVHTFPLPSHSFPNLTAFSGAVCTGFAGALSCANTPVASPTHKHATIAFRQFMKTHSRFAQALFHRISRRRRPACHAEFWWWADSIDDD